MEFFEAAVNAAFQFGLAVVVIALACLIICEAANSIARLRYTEEKTAYLRDKRLASERQRKVG